MDGNSPPSERHFLISPILFFLPRSIMMIQRITADFLETDCSDDAYPCWPAVVFMSWHWTRNSGDWIPLFLRFSVVGQAWTPSAAQLCVGAAVKGRASVRFRILNSMSFAFFFHCPWPQSVDLTHTLEYSFLHFVSWCMNIYIISLVFPCVFLHCRNTMSFSNSFPESLEIL